MVLCRAITAYSRAAGTPIRITAAVITCSSYCAIAGTPCVLSRHRGGSRARRPSRGRPGRAPPPGPCGGARACGPSGRGSSPASTRSSSATRGARPVSGVSWPRQSRMGGPLPFAQDTAFKRVAFLLGGLGIGSVVPADGDGLPVYRPRVSADLMAQLPAPEPFALHRAAGLRLRRHSARSTGLPLRRGAPAAGAGATGLLSPLVPAGRRVNVAVLEPAHGHFLSVVASSGSVHGRVEPQPVPDDPPDDRRQDHGQGQQHDGEHEQQQGDGDGAAKRITAFSFVNAAAKNTATTTRTGDGS